MNREERIELLKESIKTTESKIFYYNTEIEKSIINEYIETCKKNIDILVYQKEIFKRELTLLQIPPRTIETLEVGDIVLFKVQDDDKQVLADNIFDEKILVDYKTSFRCDFLTFVDAYPKQYLELWEALKK